MPRMTHAEVAAYIARRMLNHHPDCICTQCLISAENELKDNIAIKERDLHDAILAECRSRGWYVVHCRMDRPTTVGVGTPDFIIAAPCGATFWIEVKSKRGKLTKEQQAAGAWLRKHGHAYAIVHSLQEFMEAVK